MEVNELKLRVGKKILSIMESGKNPFQVPYTEEAGSSDLAKNYPVNFSTNKVYTGVNQYLLSPGYYLTFNQAKALGGRVKKGAASEKIYFRSAVKKPLTDEDTALKERINESVRKNPLITSIFLGKIRLEKEDGVWYKVMFVDKFFSVFNLKDIEGIEIPNDNASIEEITYPLAKDVISSYCDNENYDFIVSTEPKVDFDERKVIVPKRSQFQNDSDYYQVVFNTLSESTGPVLKRSVGRVGSEKYSKEMLVNEIAGILSIASLGLSSKECNANSGAYLKAWAKMIQGNSLEEKIWSCVTDAINSYKKIFSYQQV